MPLISTPPTFFFTDKLLLLLLLLLLAPTYRQNLHRNHQHPRTSVLFAIVGVLVTVMETDLILSMSHRRHWALFPPSTSPSLLLKNTSYTSRGFGRIEHALRMYEKRLSAIGNSANAATPPKRLVAFAHLNFGYK